MFQLVEYANEANRIAHYAENLYKLDNRLELSDPRYVRTASAAGRLSHIHHTEMHLHIFVDAEIWK